jgi:biopolymer transport protein ExbD
MARNSRIQIASEDTELNMTPMLDVVFILLIFFIVTSVFVKTTGIDPFKPVATTSAEVKPGILIGISSDDQVWIDKMPYNVNAIRPIVLAMRDENPKASAIIIDDRHAKAGTVMQVQQLMSDLGVTTRVSTTAK